MRAAARNEYLPKRIPEERRIAPASLQSSQCWTNINRNRDTAEMKRTIGLLLLTGLLARGGELAELHSKQGQSGGLGKSRSHEEVESTKHGITEIGVERTICFGTCPAYTFIVKSDGTFRYKGEEHAKRKGEFTGRIELWDFHRLAQFIKDSGYMNLENDYFRAVTDNPTTFTTVVLEGRRKIVRNYADAGPTKLWAIEQLIDDLMNKAEWAPRRK